MVQYPKLAMSHTTRGLQGGMNTSNSVAVPATHVFQNNTALQVAPSRYSNVRKVIFSLCCGKLGNGTTSTCTLTIRIGSTTTPGLTAEQFTLAASSVVQGATDYGFTPTELVGGGVSGATTTIVQAAVTAGERDQAQMLQVEYDREDSNAADFFTAWDSFSSDDNYIMIQPVVNSLTADTGAVIAYRFKTFQLTVIQEEDTPNNTCTDWHGFIGCRDELENTTTFQGTTFAPRMPFHYIAADWNGIDDIHCIFYGTDTGTTTQLSVRLYNITASTTVFTETFSLAAAGLNYYVARTQNFVTSLIDGNLYVVDYLLDAANNIGDPRGNGYFSVIQKGFTRTVTFHQVPNLSFTPATVTEADMSAVLFDPAWYSDSPPTIRENKLVSAFIHNDAANTADQSLRVDTDLGSDDSGLGSGTAVDVTPNHSFTSTPTGEKSLFTDILTNDPIDQTVQVRLQKSFPAAGSWLAGIGDFPGHMGVYYAYEVPDESPSLSQFGIFDPGFDSDIGPI